VSCRKKEVKTFSAGRGNREPGTNQVGDARTRVLDCCRGDGNPARRKTSINELLRGDMRALLEQLAGAASAMC